MTSKQKQQFTTIQLSIMKDSEIKELWGKDLYRVFGGHIDKDGWLTNDWSGTLENEVPRFDKDYNDNPEYTGTYNRMYLMEFEDNADNTMIKPIRQDLY